MACPRALVLLVLLAACPVLSLGRGISEEKAEATTDERSSGARMLAVRKRSPSGSAVPCTQTGTKYNCTFCNDDRIIYKGVQLLLDDGQMFNPSTTSNRQNINKQGNLDATLKPGECIKFSFASTGPVTFYFDDYNLCSSRPYFVGVMSYDDTIGNLSFVLGACYSAVQIFNPSGQLPISCQVSCRPYNYYGTVTNPVFSCSLDDYDPFAAQAQVRSGGNPTLPIYQTSGQLTVIESTQGACKLQRKLTFGEGGLFGFTYYYTTQAN